MCISWSHAYTARTTKTRRIPGTSAAASGRDGFTVCSMYRNQSQERGCSSWGITMVKQNGMEGSYTACTWLEHIWNSYVNMNTINKVLYNWRCLSGMKNKDMWVYTCACLFGLQTVFLGRRNGLLPHKTELTWAASSQNQHDHSVWSDQASHDNPSQRHNHDNPSQRHNHDNPSQRHNHVQYSASRCFACFC